MLVSAKHRVSLNSAQCLQSLVPKSAPERKEVQCSGIRHTRCSRNTWGDLSHCSNSIATRSQHSRRVSAEAAFNASFDMPAAELMSPSGSDDVGWVPGEVYEVTSKQEIRRTVREQSNRKIILMCKSRSCRPCKAFSFTYGKFAKRDKDIVLMSLYGEDTSELRRLMMDGGVTKTPTFVCFWKGSAIHRHAGINKESMEKLLESDWDELAKSSSRDLFDDLLTLDLQE